MRQVIVPLALFAATIAFAVSSGRSHAAPAIAATGAPQEPAVSDPSIRPTKPTLPVITADERLLDQFGGKAGLTALMDDAMARWLQNPRTRPFFANADQARIKDLLVKQFCVIMHGPCEYDGRTMAEAHRGMAVHEGSFYALVEELQVAMNKRNIPFTAQNRLLAGLAPMHHDIIEK